MHQFRGLLMLAAAGVAFYRAWRMHSERDALIAFALGLLAVALAVWHLTRSPRRVRLPHT